jgi:hypothetical protein
MITSPSTTPTITISEKEVIAGIFITSCVIGISFTLRPNWVRQYLPKIQNREKNTRNGVTQSFRGHHPDCYTFQNHTIHWKDKTWCAGCLGLLIGLCVSILLMMFYIITEYSQRKMISYLLYILGLFILTVVYLEIVYGRNHPTFHVFSNSMLPISFFLITISVVGRTGKSVYGLFTVLFCFLWLDARIHLSKWRHRRLCTYCTESCKMYDARV